CSASPPRSWEECRRIGNVCHPTGFASCAGLQRWTKPGAVKLNDRTGSSTGTLNLFVTRIPSASSIVERGEPMNLPAINEVGRDRSTGANPKPIDTQETVLSQESQSTLPQSIRAGLRFSKHQFQGLRKLESLIRTNAASLTRCLAVGDFGLRSSFA